MSINTGHAYGGVLIFSGECILLYCDCVDLKFDCTEAPYLRGAARRGRLYLTTHRMIFTNNNSCDVLQSFSFPFTQLSRVELEQPIFGCNHIKGCVSAIPYQDLHMDQWTGTALFKLYFKNGGACEFGMSLLQAAKMAAQHAVNNPPPPYVPPIEPFHQAPQCVYTPPPGSFGMVLPTHLFPNQPPCNSVYMTEQPPPYPGINTSSPAYPGAHAHGADSKAQEAAASAPPQPAYYDPNNPHCTYLPQPPPYSQPPPTYDEATKKTQ